MVLCYDLSHHNTLWYWRYTVMLRCWAEQPADRPTFSDIEEFLSLALRPKDNETDQKLDIRGLYSSSFNCEMETFLLCLLLLIIITARSLESKNHVLTYMIYNFNWNDQVEPEQASKLPWFKFMPGNETRPKILEWWRDSPLDMSFEIDNQFLGSPGTLLYLLFFVFPKCVGKSQTVTLPI